MKTDKAVEYTKFLNSLIDQYRGRTKKPEWLEEIDGIMANIQAIAEIDPEARTERQLELLDAQLSQVTILTMMLDSVSTTLDNSFAKLVKQLGPLGQFYYPLLLAVNGIIHTLAQFEEQDPEGGLLLLEKSRDAARNILAVQIAKHEQKGATCH